MCNFLFLPFQATTSNTHTTEHGRCPSQWIQTGQLCRSVAWTLSTLRDRCSPVSLNTVQLAGQALGASGLPMSSVRTSTGRNLLSTSQKCQPFQVNNSHDGSGFRVPVFTTESRACSRRHSTTPTSPALEYSPYSRTSPVPSYEPHGGREPQFCPDQVASLLSDPQESENIAVPPQTAVAFSSKLTPIWELQPDATRCLWGPSKSPDAGSTL